MHTTAFSAEITEGRMCIFARSPCKDFDFIENFISQRDFQKLCCLLRVEHSPEDCCIQSEQAIRAFHTKLATLFLTLKQFISLFTRPTDGLKNVSSYNWIEKSSNPC